jgi:hypothetical protein
MIPEAQFSRFLYERSNHLAHHDLWHIVGSTNQSHFLQYAPGFGFTWTHGNEELHGVALFALSNTTIVASSNLPMPVRPFVQKRHFTAATMSCWFFASDDLNHSSKYSFPYRESSRGSKRFQ